MTATPLRLYDLPAEFAAIDAAITDLDGELTPELAERLDHLECTLEDKVEAIASLVRTAEAEADYFASEADRLANRKRSATNKASRLKDYLKQNLEALGRDRVKTPRFTVRLQNNSGPSIAWVAEAPIPDGFQRVRVELDGDAARQAWKAGTLPAGFKVVTGRHLRIG